MVLSEWGCHRRAWPDCQALPQPTCAHPEYLIARRRMRWPLPRLHVVQPTCGQLRLSRLVLRHGPHAAAAASAGREAARVWGAQVGGEFAVSAAEQRRQLQALKALDTCLAALTANAPGKQPRVSQASCTALAVRVHQGHFDPSRASAAWAHDMPTPRVPRCPGVLAAAPLRCILVRYGTQATGALGGFCLAHPFDGMCGDGPEESARPCALQSARRGDRCGSGCRARAPQSRGLMCRRAQALCGLRVQKTDNSACLCLGRRALCRAQRAVVPPGLGAHGPARVGRRRRRPLRRDPGLTATAA